MYKRQGEDGELLDGRAVVKDVAVVSQEGAEGERTLRVEVLLGITAWADRREDVTVLQDAYTTAGDDVRLTRTPVRCRVEDHEVQAAESGKLMLMRPEGSPAARTVLCLSLIHILHHGLCPLRRAGVERGLPHRCPDANGLYGGAVPQPAPCLLYTSRCV